jgi:hypothetical protein
MRRYVINVRTLFTLVAVTVALTATATAQGVIGGNLDAGQHPASGALLVPGPNGLAPECSGVLIAPLMPGINDSPEQVEEIVRIAEDWSGGRSVPILIHIGWRLWVGTFIWPLPQPKA